jgi:hypothetical protein
VFHPASVASTFDSIAHMEYEKELDLSVGGDGITCRRISIFKSGSSRILLTEETVN